MRTRQEIKAIGRDHFRTNYWPCVGAVFLVMLVIYAVSYLFSNTSAAEDAMIAYFNQDYTSFMNVMQKVSSTSTIGSLILLVISGPLTIGLNYFFIRNLLGYTAEINVGTPFTCAVQNFGRKLGGSLWMALFTFLWSLLFVIPGIIKGFFSYALTPYILADCPNVRATDALKLSMRIMYGRKGRLFGFYLSYLGWAILDLFTLGLLGIFYVRPYYASAKACWYLEAREEALRSGAITIDQLNGIQPV